MSIAEASAAIDAAMKRIGQDTQERAAARAFRLVVGITSTAVKESRVDTGWYRANWGIRTSPANAATRPGRGPFAPAVAPAASIFAHLRSELGKSGVAAVYIVNPVTYAGFLERRYATLSKAAIANAQGIK